MNKNAFLPLLLLGNGILATHTGFASLRADEIILLRVTPNSLVGSQDTPRILATTVAQGEISLNVKFWQQGERMGAPGNSVIDKFEIKDQSPADGSDKPGRIEFELASSMNKTGRYLISDNNSTTGAFFIREPPTWRSSILSFPTRLRNRLLNSTGSGRNPDPNHEMSILASPLPATGERIESDQIVRLATGESPVFSHDSQRLAISIRRAENARIAVAETSALRDFEELSNPGASQCDVSPAWSPDGQSIAFIRKKKRQDAGGELWVASVAADSVTERRLWNSTDVVEIYIWDEHEGILFAVQGSNELEGIWALKPSGDGEPAPVRVASSIPGGVFRARAGDRVVRPVYFTDSQNRVGAQLREYSADGRSRLLFRDTNINEWPTLSPDGKWIAWQSNRENE